MKSSNYNGTLIKSAVVKTMIILGFITAVFILGGIVSYAGSEPALTVRLNDENVKEFTLEDLQAIAAEEGDLTYSYSAWNTYPSFSISSDVHGPTVDAVLTSAGVKDQVGDTCTVKFSDASGYSASLTGIQLFGETRYVFPSGNLVKHAEGTVPESAYDGKEIVKAVISTEQKDNYKLFVGQAAPNEENNPLFVKYLASGGFIDVSTEPAPQCSPVEADPVSGTMWKTGKEITLKSSNNYEYDKIYYSYGRNSEPGYGCAIYNCGPKQDLECKPVIDGSENPVVIETVVKGYGKQDSPVKRFVYYVGDALTVKVDGETAGTYDPDEMSTISNLGEIKYSGYNSFPSLQTKTIGAGTAVDAIILDATGTEVNGFGRNSIIKFTASDGYSSSFTIGQLFGKTRYYFPKASEGTDQKGGKAEDAAYEGSIEVPAVIDLTGDNCLAFGQVAPNEQNYSEFVSEMLSGGVIEITTAEAEKCLPVTGAVPGDGSVICKGTEIRFPDLEKADKRNKEYYIVDPEEGGIPGEGCDFYHYSPYNWPEEMINPPVLTEAGTHTVAVRVSAYGRQDSEVVKYTYYVLPDAPVNVKASSLTYSSIKITWSGDAGASGYRIYRKEGSGEAVLIGTAAGDAASYADTGLKTGTEYTYSIAAFIDGENGECLEGKKSAEASAKPQLKKPTLKLKAGKKKITVKWSKISGASGYVIYRSSKKSSGYKAVKTIKNGKTVSFTNKKLKKGKKYYYKVRAYRTVNGKKVYGPLSAVKYAKSK